MDLNMKKEYPKLYNKMKKRFRFRDTILNEILEMFSDLCWSCGDMNPSCQCENDE